MVSKAWCCSGLTKLQCLQVRWPSSSPSICWDWQTPDWPLQGQRLHPSLMPQLLCAPAAVVVFCALSTEQEPSHWLLLMSAATAAPAAAAAGAAVPRRRNRQRCPAAQLLSYAAAESPACRLHAHTPARGPAECCCQAADPALECRLLLLLQQQLQMQMLPAGEPFQADAVFGQQLRRRRCWLRLEMSPSQASRCYSLPPGCVQQLGAAGCQELWLTVSRRCSWSASRLLRLLTPPPLAAVDKWIASSSQVHTLLRLELPCSQACCSRKQGAALCTITCVHLRD